MRRKELEDVARDFDRAMREAEIHKHNIRVWIHYLVTSSPIILIATLTWVAQMDAIWDVSIYIVCLFASVGNYAIHRSLIRSIDG